MCDFLLIAYYFHAISTLILRIFISHSFNFCPELLDIFELYFIIPANDVWKIGEFNGDAVIFGREFLKCGFDQAAILPDQFAFRFTDRIVAEKIKGVPRSPRIATSKR